MEAKKNFLMPEIEVVHFDEQDVITASGEIASIFAGVYDLSGWKDF